VNEKDVPLCETNVFLRFTKATNIHELIHFKLLYLRVADLAVVCMYICM